MSKLSPGGFIQLPIPDDTYTWEQYKAIYGIDLDEIFDVLYASGSYFVKQKYNKPVLLKDDNVGISLYSSMYSASGNASPEDAYAGYIYQIFDITDASVVQSIGIVVKGNKTIDYIDL